MKNNYTKFSMRMSKKTFDELEYLADKVFSEAKCQTVRRLIEDAYNGWHGHDEDE